MTATNMKKDGMRNNMAINMMTIDHGCPVCGGHVKGSEEYRYVCLHCKLSFKAEELNSPEARDHLAFKKELDDLNARWEEFRKKLKTRTAEIKSSVQEYDRKPEAQEPANEAIVQTEMPAEAIPDNQTDIEKLISERPERPDLDAISKLFK